MTSIIAEPCIGTKDTACVDVCPVDCIHPRKDEAEFAEATQLYINPDECIDCGACEPACPVTAIFPEEEVTEEPMGELIRVAARSDVVRVKQSPSNLRARESLYLNVEREPTTPSVIL